MAADSTASYELRLKDLMSKKLDGINRRLNTMEGNTKRNQKSVMNLGKVMAGAFIATGAIRAISGTVKAFDMQAQAIAQVDQGLKSTGATVGFTSKELQKMASNLQSITTFGDEDILKGVTSQLLTFTNITGDAFKRTQVATLDLATRMGTDLKSASIQLGKALNDPVANMGALSRSGIQFSKDQKKVIKTLAETGRLAEAQSIILGELEKQFGGSAEAAALAGSGPLKQFSNSMGDIKERIGGVVTALLRKLVPALKMLVKILNSVFDFMQRNAEVLKKIGIIVGIMAAAFLSYVIALKLATVAQLLFNAVMSANPISLIIIGIAALIAIVVVFKEEFLLAGRLFGAFVKFQINGVKAIGNAFKNVFGAIGTILKGVFTLDSKLIAKGKRQFKNAFKGAFDVPKAQFKKDIESALNQFKNAKKKQASEDKKREAALKSKEAAATVLPTSVLPGTSIAKSAKIKTASGDVVGTKKTSVVLNINTLIESFNVKTQNMTEGAVKIKEEVVKAILSAVNDAAIIENR